MTVIGVDEGEREGTVRVTYQISKPRNFSSRESATSAEDAAEIISLEAPSLFASRNLINVGTSRVLTLVQAKVLVVSDAFAKQGDVLQRLDSLVRERDFRRDIVLVTVKGKAEEFIRANKPQLEKAPYRFYELISQTAAASGLVPDTQLHDFIVDSESPNRTAVTVLASLQEEGGEGEGQPFDLTDLTAGELRIESANRVQFLGSAVYRAQKLVGTLTGRETRMMQLIQGRVQQFNLFIADPDEEGRVVSMQARQQERPGISVNPFAEPIRIRVRLRLDLDLAGQQNDQASATSQDRIRKLERAVNRRLQDMIERVVDKSQRELGGDIFRFYRVGRLSCMTDGCWSGVRWDDRYPRAKVDVEVVTHIRRTGKQLETVRGSGA